MDKASLPHVGYISEKEVGRSVGGRWRERRESLSIETAIVLVSTKLSGTSLGTIPGDGAREAPGSISSSHISGYLLPVKNESNHIVYEIPTCDCKTIFYGNSIYSRELIG